MSKGLPRPYRNHY